MDLSSPLEVSTLIRHLETSGYHRFWATEHRSPKQSASPLVIAAMAASITSRIRVGTAGIMLRYCSPLKVAEDFTLLDLLFPGRIDIGTIGIKEADSEVHAALLDGRSDHPESYHEKVAALASYLRAVPSPINVASTRTARSLTPPPLWVCSLSEPSARVAGECGCNFAYNIYLPQLRGMIPSPAVLDTYRQHYATRERGAPYAVIACYGVCAESSDAAQAIWRRSIGVGHGANFVAGVRMTSDGIPNPNFLGTPNECREQLLVFADQYHVTELVVQCLGTDLQTRVRSYQLLADAFEIPTREIMTEDYHIIDILKIGR